jgi:predicted O-methyltransferase YrrM
LTIARSAAPRDVFAACFAEPPSCYVLEIAPEHLEQARAALDRAGVEHRTIGQLNASGVLTEVATGLSAVVGDLAGIWRSPLDWQ